MQDRSRRAALPLVGSWTSGRTPACDACGHACHRADRARVAELVDRSFSAVADRALSRRQVLRGVGATTMVLAAGGCTSAIDRGAQGLAPRPSVTAAVGGTEVVFTPVSAAGADSLLVAEGYEWAPVARWGDPVLDDGAALDGDLANLTLEQQQGAVGYNCDFLALMPDGEDRWLLWINHESATPPLMFADEGVDHEARVAIHMAAVGGTLIALRSEDAGLVVSDRRDRNRRVTAMTPIALTGPAAGHDLLRTTADPAGTEVLGTLANCAGGVTPWGTILSAEENIAAYFGTAGAGGEGDDADLHAPDAANERMGVRAEPSAPGWERVDPRFDLAVEPNEPNRFGWIVEIDPRDPTAVPRKHTALGRFAHEGAKGVVAPDGRYVVYLGDDGPFEHLHKFVSEAQVDDDDAEAGSSVLEAGVLHVAIFEEDQTGRWMPLVAGADGLTPDDGFADQAAVLVGTRLAGDAVGATPMDRTEDVLPDPSRPGHVYVACSKNPYRTDAVNAANPRLDNRWGHVIEIVEDDEDPSATTFRWDFLLICGDPADDSTYFGGADPDAVSPICAPDNLALTPTGNLLITTDGQQDGLGLNDAVHVVTLDGPDRGTVRQLVAVPITAEPTGPVFTPDGRTLLLSVQHPGAGGTVAEPLSSFPDEGMPARPTVVAIWRTDGGPVA